MFPGRSASKSASKGHGAQQDLDRRIYPIPEISDPFLPPRDSSISSWNLRGWKLTPSIELLNDSVRRTIKTHPE